jgi:hypothetical protein
VFAFKSFSMRTGTAVVAFFVCCAQSTFAQSLDLASTQTTAPAPTSTSTSGSIAIISGGRPLMLDGGGTGSVLAATGSIVTTASNVVGTAAAVTSGVNTAAGGTVAFSSSSSSTISATLTAAQQLAASQVLTTGAQALILSSSGSAIGGTIFLGTTGSWSGHQAPFEVPSGVTVVRDFGKSGALNLLGDFRNAGTFYAVSTNATVTNAIISAKNVINSGTLSTLLPTGGLAGYAGAIPNLDLTLKASESIQNTGTISGAKDIALVARRSEDGFNVFNAGGTVSAPNGTISIQNGFAPKGVATNVLGGVFVASRVMANAGAGDLRLMVDRITGPLDVTAGTAHSGTFGGSLQLGAITITGDPTFYTLGDMIVTAPITVAEKLALLATGNIDLGNQTITARSPSGVGQDITIIAGAKLTPMNGAVACCSPGTPEPGVNNIAEGTSVKVSGVSLSGGSIVCDGCVIDATSSIPDSRGGNVLLAAYGVGASGGEIDLANSGIGPTGRVGNVTAIAPNEIVLGLVSAAEGATITLSNAQPASRLIRGARSPARSKQARLSIPQAP